MSKQHVTKQSEQPEDTARPHPAFSWQRSHRIESLDVVVNEFQHRATGASHIHIANDNPENVFLVALRTVPQDSSGVAHILEHTVLCGSERYPVRDPFFMMIRRSLNTFMNAFTSSDWTAYPFASQNRKDFYNLLDVYLDAVFFARLDRMDFAQEGHRVELAEPGNPDGPLTYKGVVYNEMKGAMSSPVNVLWQTLGKYLYPTTTYHYNSGGEPAEIPNLSYEELRAFYRTHYHPSNAVFMTFGDIPAHDHQQRFEERALSRFTPLDTRISVEDERRLTAPVICEECYILDGEEDTENKTHVVLAWLLGHSTDLQDLFRAHLLTTVLLDNGASPLRQALETTALGSAPSPLCGLEDSNREMAFLCGLEGSTPERAEEVEALVLDVLRRVAREGVPQDQVEAALHQLELAQREIGGDSYPYGLQLILSALPAAIHRGDPIAVLDLDPALSQLRQDIQDPRFIPRLVDELLLANSHRVRLTLRPDTELGPRQREEEVRRLAALKASMDQKQIAAIVAQAEELERRQNRQDDPDILPKVGLDDVPAEMLIATGEQDRIAGMPVSFYPQGTNGLVYQQVIIDLPALDESLLPVLPFYTRALTELGCGTRDYLETQAWQSAVSGGISAFSSIRGTITDVQAVRGHFILSGKALVRNHDQFCELMHNTLAGVRFDELDRIREIIAQERARLDQSITGHGHSLAMSAAASGMSPAAAFSHRVRGLEGIRNLRSLDTSLKAAGNRAALAEKLAAIHAQVLAAPRQALIIAEDDKWPPLRMEFERRWQDFPPASTDRAFTLPAIRSSVRQCWTTSTQVNFCAKVYPTVPIEHPDAAALDVLGGFLRNGFLHRAIREQGGAYGGGAAHDADIAAFRFYSYRDPRLTDTLADFDRAIDWLLTNRHEPQQLEEAILGVIGTIDKPASPAGEAKDAFHNALYGRTPEQRKQHRRRILEVTMDDLLQVGKTYLDPAQASIAVITRPDPPEALNALGLELCRL